MKNIILFCQATADIQYALTIYERNKAQAKISIFCINVEGMYKFLLSLELELEELIFIPYDFFISIKKPASILKTKRKIKRHFEKHFKTRIDSDVYFFSHFFDYMTFFFVSKLSVNNTCFFINHYDDASDKNYIRPGNSVKLFLSKATYYVVTGIRFYFFEFNKRLIAEFPYLSYAVIEKKNDLIDENVVRKYAFNIVVNNIKSVLFLETNQEKLREYCDYESVTNKTLEVLKSKGYAVFLKPHPRLGYSKFIEESVTTIVDDSIPAEFINESEFDLILGTSSTSLALYANRNKTKVVSLLNMYQPKDQKTANRALEYLNNLSSSINFISNFSEFENEIQ